MLNSFKKRSFSFGSFIRVSQAAVKSIPKMARIMRTQSLSSKLIEKLMLSVTSVNGCRYCSWFHSAQAVKTGISLEEISQLMEFDLGACTEEEALACAYAQHFAETEGNTEKAVTLRLIKEFGAEKTRDIIAVIQMITFGNLWGNSIDAFLARLRGTPIEKETIFMEFLLFLISLPVFPLILRTMNKSSIQI